MIGFLKVSLKSLIKEVGENEVGIILSDFLCPMNRDVEHFLHSKAIEFENHGWSATQLIYTSYKGKSVLVGYYTLTNKCLIVENQAISRGLKKRLSQFATYDPAIKKYFLPAPLIGQLGKNFNHGYNALISGDELLKIAIDEIKLVQQSLGGKVVYIECEDVERLKEFYIRNGFVEFDKRKLDTDETDIDGQYLIQMLKYLK